MQKVIIFIIGTIIIWIVGYFVSNFLYGFVYGIADNFGWIDDNTTFGTLMKMQFVTTAIGYLLPLAIAERMIGLDDKAVFGTDGEIPGILNWGILGASLGFCLCSDANGQVSVILLNIGFAVSWIVAVVKS